MTDTNRAEPMKRERDEFWNLIHEWADGGTEDRIEWIEHEIDKRLGLVEASRLPLAGAALHDLMNACRWWANQEDGFPARVLIAYRRAAMALGRTLSEPCELAGAAPSDEPCPLGDQKPEATCTNRHQCWEPCGELGHSEEHAVAASSGLSAKIKAATSPLLTAPAAPTELQAVEALVSALVESRGWMKGYAHSIVMDALERTAPAGAREAMGKAVAALSTTLVNLTGPYYGIPAGTPIDGAAILSMQQRHKEDEEKLRSAIKDTLESLRAALAAAPLERIALSEEQIAKLWDKHFIVEYPCHESPVHKFARAIEAELAQQWGVKIEG